MYEILDKDHYKEYEDFVLHHKNGSFMQSVHWAELKRNWGQAVLVSRGEDGKIRGGMTILTQELQGYGKNFLYAPRGPVMDFLDEEAFADLVEGLHELAKRLNAFHFKMDPMVLSTDEAFIDMAKGYGFSYDPEAGDGNTIQMRANYMIDLTPFGGDEEALNKSFHPKWRYNIRLAERKGVECRICGHEAVEDFEMLFRITGIRDNFIVRPKGYFDYFLDALQEHVRLYMCYYDGKPLSGAICTNYAGKTCYVYGASSNENRNCMPNHLMQWNMMKWALETGCFLYDFQGIPMELENAAVMAGVYRFKRGFNGKVVLFAGEFEMIFDSEVKAASDRIEQEKKEQKKKIKEEALKKRQG